MATGGDHVPEHCPACGLQVGGGGEVPQLALARSERFVRVLSQPLVEQLSLAYVVCAHARMGMWPMRVWSCSLPTALYKQYSDIKPALIFLK